MCQTRAARGLVFFLLLCGADIAPAAGPIVGSVLAVRGAVTLDAGQGPQPVAVNAPVHLGDTVSSAAGKAKISLDDGTVISVGEMSEVRIADFAKTSEGFNVRVKLVSGALRSLVAKVGSKGRFEIETETAVAAVRGTDWLIEAAPERTAVAIIDGTVAVSSRGLLRKTVVLDAPGHGTDVLRGEPPTAVKKWGEKRFDDLLARATF